MTWWRRLVRGRQLEQQLEAELRDHVERQVADLVRSGLSEQDARRRAHLALGGMEQVKERCRDVRGTLWLEQLAQDVRYALRLLHRSRAFTAVAVLSLAFGIGANTAIFSLVNSLLLRTLPVRDPDRLLLLEGGSWTNPIWEEIRARQLQLFDGAAAWSPQRFDLARGGPSHLVDGMWVSGEFFDVLGVPAVLGRTLTPADDTRGGGRRGPVAVIGYGFWQRHFGGRADVIGRTLTLNRVTFAIIGVTPAEFRGLNIGRTFDVAVPIATTGVGLHEPFDRLDGRSTWWLEVVVRRKPGQSPDAATAALRAVQPQIRDATLPLDWRADDLARYLGTPLTFRSAAAGFGELRVQYQRPLLTIMVVVGLVLLIACANIASLLLARAAERQHEFAMRRALGAPARRLARQLLTESLLLSALGAGLGLVFAQWGSRILVGQLSTADSLVSLDLTLDWRVLGFTTAAALITAVLFGTAPALRASRADPHDALAQQGRTVAGRRRSPAQPLVIAQVALTLVLVFAAGLFVRTFENVMSVDLGLDREAVLHVAIDAQPTGLKGADLTSLLYRIRDAAAAVPGVARAGVSTIAPMSGMQWNNYIEFPDRPPVPRDEDHMVFFNAVTPSWFGTYRTPLLAGRDFTNRDRTGAPPVAIVNETFARKHMRDSSALGQRVRSVGGPNRPQPTFEIVGVVKDAVYREVREPIPPVIYLPIAQMASDDVWPFANLSVQAEGGAPSLLVRDVAAAIRLVNRDVSLTFRAFADQVNATLIRERLIAIVSGFFGALSLLLAAIGLYGVTASSVTSRRTEIGVRMALGADARRVVRLVLVRVAVLAGAGMVLGAVLSFWASRYVSTLLYGLDPRDASTLGAAMLVLGLTAALAGWLPARRAARIDAAEVLREG